MAEHQVVPAREVLAPDPRSEGRAVRPGRDGDGRQIADRQTAVDVIDNTTYVALLVGQPGGYPGPPEHQGEWWEASLAMGWSP